MCYRTYFPLLLSLHLFFSSFPIHYKIYPIPHQTPSIHVWSRLLVIRLQRYIRVNLAVLPPSHTDCISPDNFLCLLPFPLTTSSFSTPLSLLVYISRTATSAPSTVFLISPLHSLLFMYISQQLLLPPPHSPPTAFCPSCISPYSLLSLSCTSLLCALSDTKQCQPCRTARGCAAHCSKRRKRREKFSLLMCVIRTTINASSRH